MPSWDAVAAFLRRANPSIYGSPEDGAGRSRAVPSTSQANALEDAASGLFHMMSASAARSPEGLLLASECPILYDDNDPRNVWALEGRLHAPTRTISLPLARVTVTVQQRWNEPGAGGREMDRGDAATDIEGHSTAAVCWDGSVVLADLLCLPPPALLTHSVTLARNLATYAEWRWAEKTVVELGCGIAALPALAAARNGARRVVCTDGNAKVLRLTHANAMRWAREHPGVEPPQTMALAWGDGDRACAGLRAIGVDAPIDVLLAADCIYVLDNPGAWGKLLKTIVALSAPHTLTFVTYTDRGHNKLWERFVAQRVQPLFHIVRVGEHLLHPFAQTGASGRLEQHLSSAVQVFCWALKDAGDADGSQGESAPPGADLGPSPLSAPPSPPSSPSPPSLPPSPPSSPSLPPSPPPSVESPSRQGLGHGDGAAAAAAATADDGGDDGAERPASFLFDGLATATQVAIVHRAEERLRENNLEAFLAFGDGEVAATFEPPPTPAVQDKDAVWVVRDVLTPHECASVRDAVDRAAAARGGWEKDRHGRYPTTDLPLSAALSLEPHLREVVFARILRPLAPFYCGEAFLPEHLEVREAFFVKYSAEAGHQRELAMHTDGSLFSFNLLLSDPTADFDGGGTAFESTRWTVRAPQGAAVVHSGTSVHGGCPVLRGERYLLVGFVEPLRGPAYCLAEVGAAAEDAFSKFGHAAWDRSRATLTPTRLTSSSAEVHSPESGAWPKGTELTNASTSVEATPAASSDATAAVEMVAHSAVGEASEAGRRSCAALRLQAAQRGKAGRALAALVVDEALMAEVGEEVARAGAARAETGRDTAAARASLFAACSASIPEAARMLLTSEFQPSSNLWETQDERLALLPAGEHQRQQASPSSLCDAFSSYDCFELPDDAAPSRVQPPGPKPSNGRSTTSVHRFRLSQHLRATLLPALRGAALQQRRDDPLGVQVSNVGGWHATEQVLERGSEGGGSTPPWYADVHSTLLAAVAHLSAAASPASERAEASPAEMAKRISGWLNSNGPRAFNALHDHGRDVEWSLVLFVATGEAEETSASDLGGSLILKTQLGPVALQQHGFLPVAAVPGDLWAFPGYMPHCVMPRAVGPGAVPCPAMTRIEDESRQRVSAAFNVYSSISVSALAFVEENMASVLQARDRASQAMEALRATRE